MAQSMLLPAIVLLLGLVAVLFFATPQHMRRAEAARESSRPAHS
jgi:hypothetical protein